MLSKPKYIRSVLLAIIVAANIVFSCRSTAQTKNQDLVSRTEFTKMRLPIDSGSDVLFYYGYWNDDVLFKAMDFKVAVVLPYTITPAQVLKLRKGHDGLLGTNDDVIVLGYLSLGEDNQGNDPGNGMGPCYYDYAGSKIVYENKGYASWYVDDRDMDGKPDDNPNWNSYYVNGGDTLWWQYLKTYSSGADDIIVTEGCDGLFLDTIDDAEPYSSWPYRWTTIGMSDLIHWLYQTYPNKYLVANRGLFYFDSTNSAAYPYTIRPYISGDLFESYYLEPNRSIWAAKLNHEAQKSDGFKIMALDYFDPSQTATIDQQMKEVFSYNWADYISSKYLDSIRYDVFHRNPTNPPTWDGPIGITEVLTSDKSAMLEWGSLTDFSKPLRFNIYYSTTEPFDISTAFALKNVSALFDSGAGRYSFKVTGLTDYTTYYFLVRVEDALGNLEKNLTIKSATPPNGNSLSITIDGNFDDWENILPLTPKPAYSFHDSDADIKDVWAFNDTSNLYLSYDVAGNISVSKYYYHVFIDVDPGVTKTGYIYVDSASIGAEYMLENSWLFEYTGPSGTDQWSWATLPGMQKADSGGRTELSIPLDVLFQSNFNRNIAFFVEVNQASSPYSQVDVAPANYKTQSYVYEVAGVTAIQSQRFHSASSYSLFQNYPNPFNPSTTISYRLSLNSFVKLVLFDELGRKIKTIVNQNQNAGVHAVNVNAVDLPSGVYFYRLQAGPGVQVKKMILIK